MTPIQTHDDYLTAIFCLNALAASDDETTDDDLQLVSEVARYEQEVLGLDPREAFAVDTEERLEWFVEKIGDLESKRKRIEAQAQLMIRDIDRQIEGLQYRYGDQAEATLRGLLKGRNKSKKFLGGTIGIRTTPARVGIQDITTLTQELPLDLLNDVSERKIDVRALNRMVEVVDGRAYRTDTGEDITINGLKVVGEREVLYVKTGKEDAARDE